MSLTRSTVNTINEITGADVLVENGSISTLESVLLAILMAEVVNLKNKNCRYLILYQVQKYHLTACLSIGIVSPRVGLAAAVKASVSLGHRDWKGLDRLGIVGPFLQ